MRPTLSLVRHTVLPLFVTCNNQNVTTLRCQASTPSSTPTAGP